MGYTTSLSWSHTRAKSFQGCPRAFFYEYYYRGEERFEKKAAVIRKLSNPDMLAGQVVDWQIRFALDNYREVQALPQDLPGRAVLAFRRMIEKSPAHALKMRWQLRKPPVNAQVMHNHFYGEDDLPKVLAACENKVETCVRNWLESELLTRILEAPVTDWMPQKDDSELTVVKWQLDALTVYSAIDFWFKSGELLHIIDWKTGRATDESVAEASRQLSGYALWGVRDQGYAPENVTTQMAFLQTSPMWEPRTFTEDDIRETERLIIGQHAEELDKLVYSRLEDGQARYDASIDEYPVRPEVKRCHDCKFRIMCIEGKALVAPYVGPKAEASVR